MDRDTFFQHLRRSELLSEQELEEAARASDSPRAKVVARVLVERGLLTRFQAGRLLAGRLARLCLGQYRLLDLLGRGAMGRVYKAIHATMDRVVAIKVILAGVFEDASAVDLFNREVRAAARLHHPNIVTAYDADQLGATRFLVMEYVDGPSLQGLVKARGPVPADLARALLRQSADALQYAHEKGMVHRDIKPANLLVAPPAGPDRPPVVKLVDFGIARVRGAGRADTIPAEPGAVFGTVDYISPEQAQDVHAVDIRSDLYSLGCTFFYALTGRVPFPGDNPMEKLLKQLMSEPQPLRELRPDVPPDLEAVILRLLAKDPAQRFQTPVELAAALDGLPGAGGPGGPVDAVAVDAVAVPAVEGPKSDGAPGRPEPDGADAPAAPPARPPERGGAPARREPADVSQPTSYTVPPTAALTPPSNRKFREKFRQWTALLAITLRKRASLRRINREAFSVLQQELVRACQAHANASEGERRAFFQRLVEFLTPWLTPEALAQTELDIHYQLAHEFQEAERELDRWLSGGPSSGDEDTTLGRFLNPFKKMREQADFKAELRKLFGVGE